MQGLQTHSVSNYHIEEEDSNKNGRASKRGEGRRGARVISRLTDRVSIKDLSVDLSESDSLSITADRTLLTDVQAHQ